MRSLYTNVILTVIAVLLAIVLLRMPALVAQAQGPVTSLQFDPEIRQFQVRSGPSSVLGRMAIDTTTGNIYGFPTDGDAYPKNLQNNDLPISRPVLLGRFDLSNLPQK
jgi:hypothetical protein